MNILVNTYCNLRCPYCFADPTMKACPVKDMSIEDFNYVLKFLIKSNIGEVRLIGGEPTLSPKFLKYIDTVISYRRFRYILIFSNFTFSQEIAEELAERNEKIPLHFLPNINEYDLLSKKNVENIKRNIKFFSENTNCIDNIGINIYRPDFCFDQFEDIIKEYKDTIKSVRYSIAIPTKKILENNFDFYEYYKSFEPALWKILELQDKYEIIFHNDCNTLPTCCFSDKLVARMYRDAVETITILDPENKFGCGYPIVDCKPDLSIAGCFGYNEPALENKTLRDFRDKTDIIKYCYDNLDDNWISRPECLNCTRYKINKCSCSCLSTHLINKNTLEKKVHTVFLNENNGD